ncbi:MAG: type II toxin-antitoxin system VapB family antitoxin, partial [Mycobacteriaceae bacterium]|nr:type II toxin-antitoxin system VapB family antitoxin [Mycobacteriaceae bacterium]
EVLRRYELGTTREAIHLALRTLLANAPETAQQDEEYDEFSDPSAWVPKRSGNTQ